MANRVALDSVGNDEADNENQNTINKNGPDGPTTVMASAVMSTLWAKKTGVNWAKDSFKNMVTN